LQIATSLINNQNKEKSLRRKHLIKKHRSKPIIINKLRSLLKRSPVLEGTKEEIQKALNKYVSGYRGEQSLDYFYRYLPATNLSFLHGIRILHQYYYFQMDTLIITPRFLLIIESKNIAGHLQFESSYDPMLRTLNDTREAFDNPVEQVKRQSYHLMEFIKEFKFPNIPIESLVVMTNPKAITEFNPSYKEARFKVIKSSGLPTKFEELDNKHKAECLSPKEIKRFIKYLLKKHSPEDPDVCSKYQVNPNHLLKGVFCPKCETNILHRRKRTWFCPLCKKNYNKAHEAALVDYALLISKSITNKACKDFLKLPSASQAYYILQSLELPHIGTKKSRIYDLDPLLKKATIKDNTLP
jgi:Nuclease-related domain